jgi:hypothetical protein
MVGDTPGVTMNGKKSRWNGSNRKAAFRSPPRIGRSSPAPILRRRAQRKRGAEHSQTSKQSPLYGGGGKDRSDRSGTQITTAGLPSEQANVA